MAPVRVRTRKTKGGQSRKWNWDNSETQSLLDAYESERQTSLNGKSPWKRSIWKRVTSRLYTSDSPIQRTHAEVRKKWQNLCAALRHELRQNDRKKGDKTPQPSLTPILAKVATIIAVEKDSKKKLVDGTKSEPDTSGDEADNSEIGADMEQVADSPISSTSSGTFVSSVVSNDSVPVCAPDLGSAAETILPTLPTSTLTRAKKPPNLSIKEQIRIPFIKDEPLSPVPEQIVNIQTPPTNPQNESQTPVNKTKTVCVTKSPQSYITFAKPTTTNTTSGPSPLRIISIVNPLSSVNPQTSTSNAQPRLFLKPMNGFANLAKPSTSNMVVLGPRAPPPPKKSPQTPVFLHRKPDEIKIVDAHVLRTEAEKLAVAQERLQIEKEKLQLEKEKLLIEKEKLVIEKQKLEHSKTLFQNEKASKRTLLEDKKLILKNKKLKGEIGKIALEKELLALQVKNLQP